MEEMEGHKNKITLLVAEMNVVGKENRELKSMLKSMSIKYNDLQKHLKFLVQQRKGKEVDRSQIINPDHQCNDVSYAKYSSGAVALQYHQFLECHEQGWETEKKIAKLVDYQLLSSKKRTVNYLESAQIENRINSPVNDSPCIHRKPPNKKHQALIRRSAAAPRRTVSIRTTSEASVGDDGCQWRKYGQRKTKSNPLPRAYNKCAWAPGCPVKKQVQRSAEDPAIVITTYEGEHTHPLTPLVMAAMHTGLSNLLTGEGMNTQNFVAQNQFIPCIASLSISSTCPTITLDLADNRTKSGSQLKSPDLATDSFHPLTPSPRNMGRRLDHSSIVEDYVASIIEDPNFTAAVAGAIAVSLLCSVGPVQGMPKCSPKRQCRDGSTRN